MPRKQDGFLKSFAEVLKEMLKRVKADYETFDFDRKNWFHDHEWTLKEQENFEKYLIDYLKKNKEARNEFMKVQSAKKGFLEKFAREFTLMWGWKIKV